MTETRVDPKAVTSPTVPEPCGTDGDCGPAAFQGAAAEALVSGFAALAEPKRLGILAQLAAGEQCACDLTSCCGDRQPLLSFHLKKLREAGLVRARKEGRWKHYTLDRDAISSLADALRELAEGEIDAGCC